MCNFEGTNTADFYLFKSCCLTVQTNTEVKLVFIKTN